MMLAAMDQSVAIDSILNHNRCHAILPPDQKNLLMTAIQNYNRLVQALGAFFHPQGIGLFNYTIKNHVMLHIGLDSDCLNPILGWSFGAEDFMQRVRHLVGASSHGSSAMHLQNNVMVKWVRGFELNLWPTMAALR